jgi:outer membrane protein assembly factor BamB
LAGLSLALAVSTNAPLGRAADWPQFRGPDRQDHSPDTGLLTSWPEGGPKQKWVFSDAGLGYAGYSVVGDTLFTMGLRGEQEYVIAVDTAQGHQRWTTPAGAKYPNQWGDGPRMTPTVDGDRVYALGAQGDLVCVSARDGAVRWHKSLVKDLGGKLQDWGFTESPLVVGNVLVITPGGPEGTLAGLDKNSGDVLWRSKEITAPAQYASPIYSEFGHQPQVIQLVTKKLFSVDPSNGKLLWQTDFPGSVAVIPTPIASPDGYVFATAGYGAGCKVVKMAADGRSVTPVYESKKVLRNHHGGVVLVGDYLYGYADGGGWTCQELKTGTEVWTSKSLGKGAIHYADGHLYCLDERSGEVALVGASPKGWNQTGHFKLSPLSTKRSPEGGIWPHPVVVNGNLYLRDQENLYCYDVKR